MNVVELPVRAERELPIIVPTPLLPCPAHSALTMEGVKHQTVITEWPHSFGALIVSLWEKGGFILVEHDIAPWPGALDFIRLCPNDLCVYRYYRWVTTDTVKYD